MKNMMKTGLILLIISLGFLSGFAQDDDKRFRIGAIPILSYDADLGLKYGAVFNLMDYKETPNQYSQYLYFKLSNSTQNTLNIQAVFESDILIPEATTYLEASYINDQKLDFWGFNGIETAYNPDFINSQHENFIDPLFYAVNRNIIRVRADVQKNISKNWRLLTGVTFNKYGFIEADDNEISLYKYYQDWGIISQDDANGGTSTTIKAGIVHDSRNDRSYCTHGSWFEGFLVYNPGLFDQQAFTKLVLTYRYYRSLKDDKYTFLFRLSAQNKISGEIPHYLLPTYYDTQLNQDGLGGAFNLRGITRNRIVADGFALGNFESRIKLASFPLFGLDWDISGTAFFDAAYITQPYKYNSNLLSSEDKTKHFSDQKQPLYLSFGPGINIVYNKTNITTVNYGFSPNKQFGKGGLYIGSRFLF